MKHYARVAVRYAKGFTMAAKAEGTFDQDVPALLSFLEQARQSSAMMSFLTNVSLPRSKRMEVIAHLAQQAKLGRLSVRFLALLAEKNRLPLVPDLQKALGDLLDQHTNTLRVQLSVAHPIDEKSKKNLEEILAEKLSARVLMTVEHEPELLGGAVLHVQSRVYDGSLKRQLEKLKVLLTKEN
jgi:F-type H+-transporting ATPase subunit delta